MKTIQKTVQRKSPTFVAVCSLVAVLFASVMFTPDADAQRRGSFGGSRGGGSFGGSRGGGSTFRGAPAPSYSPRPYAPSQPAAPRSSGSFGGSRSGFGAPSGALSGAAGTGAAMNYRKSYGIPRQSSPVSVPGSSSPYMVHRYGGFSDGLMMGYLMGHTSMMWSMPFHPAFYYSRPTIVQNSDGTVEAYPPTFSFLKLFLTLAIIGVVVWLVMRYIRRRREGSGDMSQSSFA